MLIITCTYNRHSLLERVVKCFQEQDYEGKIILFIYNTGKPTTIQLENTPNREIILVNNQVSLVTGKGYLSVGEKYRDALEYTRTSIKDYVRYVVHHDDDDLFLPNHISAGVSGIEKGGLSSYKPKKSWFRHKGGTELAENVFEGSIFMTYTHLLATGYLPVSVKYHDGWLLPLVSNNQMFVDPDGQPTWIYDWSGEIPTYKMSGKADTQNNFTASQVLSSDEGDGIIIPVPLNELQPIFDKCVVY